MIADAKAISDKWETLDGFQATWRPRWDAIRRHTHPSHVVSASKPAGSSPNEPPRLYDMTMAHSLVELAAAFMHWLCDPNDQWFTLSSPIDDPQAKAWCDGAGEYMRDALATSNFYGRIHECFLEGCGPGTTAIVTGLDTSLEFESWRCGSFVFEEDAKGNLTCIIWKRSLSAKAAYAEYGDELPEKARMDAQDVQRQNTKHTFLTAIYKRTPEELAKVSQEAAEAGSVYALPYALAVLHKDSKTIVRETGYHAMPCSVWKYETWPADEESDEMYGYSPAWLALPDARNANYLRWTQLELASIASGPRLLVSTDHQGPVDLRRNGITRVENMANAPREWATVANYQIGEDSLQRCVSAIERVFQSQLVRQFGRTDKAMTATEVTARMRETLAIFAPVVNLCMTSFLKPILESVFTQLYYKGLLSQLPKSMAAAGQAPLVKFSSRLVQALEAMKADGFIEMVNLGLSMQQAGLTVIDNLDLDQGFRERARVLGVSNDTIVPEQERDERREQAAAAAAEQQQQAMMLEAAKNPELVKQVSAAM
jgi:hypothetical protein